MTIDILEKGQEINGKITKIKRDIVSLTKSPLLSEKYFINSNGNDSVDIWLNKEEVQLCISLLLDKKQQQLDLLEYEFKSLQ